MLAPQSLGASQPLIWLPYPNRKVKWKAGKRVYKIHANGPISCASPPPPSCSPSVPPYRIDRLLDVLTILRRRSERLGPNLVGIPPFLLRLRPRTRLIRVHAVVEEPGLGRVRERLGDAFARHLTLYFFQLARHQIGLGHRIMRGTCREGSFFFPSLFSRWLEKKFDGLKRQPGAMMRCSRRRMGYCCPRTAASHYPFLMSSVSSDVIHTCKWLYRFRWMKRGVRLRTRREDTQVGGEF